MGSNMMRQLFQLSEQMHLVGTGVGVVALDSGAILTAKAAGELFLSIQQELLFKEISLKMVSQVLIFITFKYQRTNQNTCNNQHALVKEGDVVKTGTVIADGPGTQYGDIALGQNVLVAFMPWGGYNYEDSILINENLLSRDVFTSVHIESFEVEARDTKLGKEEITRDIPNVNEETLKDLDEAGIIRVGAIIKPGEYSLAKSLLSRTQLS